MNGGHSSFQVQASRFAFTFVFMFVSLVLATATASAQQLPTVEFFPRFVFHMNAEHLSSDSRRFVWDADIGGDLDFISWGRNRFTFLSNYQVVLGEQIRSFDPNQGNYTLEGSTSRRMGGMEVSGVFHHVSRHLADRAKTPAVDWNMLGGRIRKELTDPRLYFDGRVDLRKTLAKSFVDYRWEVEADAVTRYTIRRRVVFTSETTIRIAAVDESRDRGTQTGIRGQAGMRFEGPGGAVELFLAAERRIDPYPMELGYGNWMGAGFRLLSR